MNEYVVYEAGKAVGKARMTREGMYWRVICTCGPVCDKVKKVFARWRGGSMPLGLCIPEGDQMRLFRRIPMNKMQLDDISFYVDSPNENTVPIDFHAPLNCISDLKNARLRIIEGKPYLLFSDSVSSRPTGQ